MNDFEVGDLVRYHDWPQTWIVYDFWRGKILVVDNEDSNHELEVFPENLRHVYTFFDLCRTWDDVRQRDLWHCSRYFAQIWGGEFAVPGEHRDLFQVWYTHFVDGRCGPLPRDLAYLYDYVTERP